MAKSIDNSPCQVEAIERDGERPYLRYTEDVSKNLPGGLKAGTSSLKSSIQVILNAALYTFPKYTGPSVQRKPFICDHLTVNLTRAGTQKHHLICQTKLVQTESALQTAGMHSGL